MRWLALVASRVLIVGAAVSDVARARAAGCGCASTIGRSRRSARRTPKLKARNDALDADVRDLKTGSEAIEERARAELGMIRQDEVFFQLQTGGAARDRRTPRARKLPPRSACASPGAAQCRASRRRDNRACAKSRG